MLTLSTVTPVYSGGEYLARLVEQIDSVRLNLANENYPIRLQEAIFVVDEAIDDSQAILDALRGQYDWIRVVCLSRNYGQHPATMAGVLHSSADWLVTLDEDLQHPPSAIIGLLAEAVEKKLDVVYAKPASAVHESWLRDLGSRGFKKLMEAVTGNDKITSFNSYRLMRGSIARAAASVCAHDTYFDIALTWFTRRMSAITLEMKDQRVISGEKSGYSFKSLLSHARRMAISSNTKLLRYVGVVGLMMFVVSLVLIVITIASHFLSSNTVFVTGWASLFVTILFFGGLFAVIATVFIEYMMGVILHINGKPTFFTVDRSSDDILIKHFVG